MLSVIAYVAITAQPNAVSTRAATDGSSAALQLRTNLRLQDGATAAAACSTSSWCTVGTALYHDGSNAASHSATACGLEKPGVARTLVVDSSAARTLIARPWMWKSGITLRQSSQRASLSVLAMLAAPEVMLSCVSGTTLGLLVVPLVCSESAT